MNLTLKVWRQKNHKAKGEFQTYKVSNISSEMSFLEMFDVLNEQLIAEGKDPIAFDHDCREGICGTCSMYINGRAHGPWHNTTTCQLHMREYKDGDTIVVEPWRAARIGLDPLRNGWRAPASADADGSRPQAITDRS